MYFFKLSFLPLLTTSFLPLLTGGSNPAVWRITFAQVWIFLPQLGSIYFSSMCLDSKAIKQEDKKEWRKITDLLADALKIFCADWGSLKPNIMSVTIDLFRPFLSTNSSTAVCGQHVEYHHTGPSPLTGKASRRLYKTYLSLHRASWCRWCILKQDKSSNLYF